MADFVMKLSYETWDTVFSNVDIDTKLNSFLNTYLRIFYSSFPFKKAKNTATNNTNLAQFQKGICYIGVKICNHLPIEIKSMSNDTKSFKSKLTTFLLQNSFYTIDEYFELKLN
jgi:hypothetical protein